jgi:hypothetical protein
MREHFTMTNLMDMAVKYLQMENIMKVSSERGKQTDLAFFKTSMEENTKVNGKMINSTVLVRRFGIMEMRPMRASSLMVKKMAAVDFYGKTAHTMKVISLMDYFMEQVHTTLKRLKRLTPEGL